MGERLETFIAACGYKKGDFAALLEMKQSQLSRYLGVSPQTPQKEILTKLFNLGCNLNWLLTGEGSIYAENEAGRALQEKESRYNPERDNNVGKVLDGRSVLEQKVYTNAITEEEVKNLESLTQKLRSML